MGKINEFFDRINQDHPLSAFTRLLNGNDKGQEKPVEYQYSNKPLSLYNISGEEIVELTPESKVNIKKKEGSNQIIVEAVNGQGVRSVITTCEAADDQNDLNEIDQMLKILVQNISRARRNGVEGLTVPINEYELVAYIQNRPSIEIDLDRLEEAINYRQRHEVLSDFISDLHQNKRVDIYTACNNIYNVEASNILKSEYQKYSNIKFYDLKENYNHMVFWNDEVILNNIKRSPEAVIIGIGLAGEKPMHAISVRNDRESSVIRKVSFLTDHTMNVREEMLNAQFLRHASGVEEVARTRNMSEEIKNKIILELAVAEAKYRYDDVRIHEFLRSILNIYYTETKMKLIRVPFNDPNLIMNLIPEASSGLLAEIKEEQIIYYGFDSAAKILVDEYGWIDMGYGRVGHDASRISMRIYEKQASETTIRARYISEMNQVLVANERRSATASYKYVKDVVLKYSDIGMDAEAQIGLLPEIPSINDPGYRVSITNIIKETLTKESPFRLFGEVRRRTKPKRIEAQTENRISESPIGYD